MTERSVKFSVDKSDDSASEIDSNRGDSITLLTAPNIETNVGLFCTNTLFHTRLTTSSALAVRARKAYFAVPLLTGKRRAVVPFCVWCTCGIALAFSSCALREERHFVGSWPLCVTSFITGTWRFLQ